MSFESRAIDASLAAAAGDDPMLVRELREAFLTSATRTADLLARSRCDGNWRHSAWRLKAIAVSFGDVALATLADEAAAAAPGDPVAVRRIAARLALIADPD